MKTFIFLTVLALAAVSCGAMDNEVEPDSNCVCAVFNISAILDVSQEEPISQTDTEFDITCDVEGYEICTKICIVVANSLEDLSNVILCELVKDTEEGFEVAVYHSVCYTEGLHTDLSSKDTFCCKNSSPVPCSTQ